MTQEELELEFSRKKAREYVYSLVISQDTGIETVDQGVNLLEIWSLLPSTYDAKQVRKSTLASMDLKKIVENVLVDVLMLRKPTTIANMATSLGMTLGFKEAVQGITLAGEILVVLAETQFYGIMKRSPNSSYYIVPNVFLDTEERAIAEKGMYLPPLIEKPKQLKHNYSTPYHSLPKETLILKGHYNHHDQFISLDVLNKQNNIALCMNVDFINEVEEEPTFDLEHIKGIELVPPSIAKDMLRLQKDNWELHLEQSNLVYQTIYDEGNKFYVPNKVDKRGRIYAQGHHINPMGTGYKKSTVELYNKETIQIPTGFFNSTGTQ